METKINVVFAHGVIDPNRYFIVPKGYSFIFLSKSGESVSNSGLVRNDIIEEVCIPQYRDFIGSIASYYHEYKEDELLAEHQVVFEPQTSYQEEKFMLTGIIDKDSPINDKDIKIYAKRSDAFRFDGKVFNERGESQIDGFKTAGRSIALSSLIEYLHPGRYLMHMCRNFRNTSMSVVQSALSSSEMVEPERVNSTEEQRKGVSGERKTAHKFVNFRKRYAHHLNKQADSLPPIVKLTKSEVGKVWAQIPEGFNHPANHPPPDPSVLEGGGKRKSKKSKKSTSRKRKETNRKNRKGECVIWVRKTKGKKSRLVFKPKN